MLRKLLTVHKFAPFSRYDHPKPPAAIPAPTPEHPEDNNLALRIVHAGGLVDRYYLAIPATTILDKYPSHVLAKPDVFRRPWDSVLRPENILRPGQKFFLVPRRTVKKLRRRIRKPDKDLSASFVSLASIHDASADMQNDDVSATSFLGRREGDKSIVSNDISGSFSTGFKKRSGTKKHVRFAGIDVKQKGAGDHHQKKGSKVGDETSSRNSSLKSSLVDQGRGNLQKPLLGGHPLHRSTKPMGTNDQTRKSQI